MAENAAMGEHPQLKILHGKRIGQKKNHCNCNGETKSNEQFVLAKSRCPLSATVFKSLE
jgi:hypothetical protein